MRERLRPLPAAKSQEQVISPATVLLVTHTLKNKLNPSDDAEIIATDGVSKAIVKIEPKVTANPRPLFQSEQSHLLEQLPGKTKIFLAVGILGVVMLLTGCEGSNPSNDFAIKADCDKTVFVYLPERGVINLIGVGDLRDLYINPKTKEVTALAPGAKIIKKGDRVLVILNPDLVGADYYEIEIFDGGGIRLTRICAGGPQRPIEPDPTQQVPHKPPKTYKNSLAFIHDRQARLNLGKNQVFQGRRW